MPFVIGFLALCGESASAQFLSSVEVGAGWRQERILSWPHRRTHEVSPYPVLSASTPFHRGRLTIDAHQSRLDRSGDEGVDTHRLQLVMAWAPDIRLGYGFHAMPSLGLGIDRYRTPWLENTSEIENLFLAGFALNRSVGPFQVQVDARWVRVMTYRPMVSRSIDATVRYRFQTPARFLDAVR